MQRFQMRGSWGKCACVPCGQPFLQIADSADTTAEKKIIQIETLVGDHGSPEPRGLIEVFVIKVPRSLLVSFHTVWTSVGRELLCRKEHVL